MRDDVRAAIDRRLVAAIDETAEHVLGQRTEDTALFSAVRAVVIDATQVECVRQRGDIAAYVRRCGRVFPGEVPTGHERMADAIERGELW